MIVQRPKFNVIYLPEAEKFLDGIPDKAREKLISNIRRSMLIIDSKFFKKLESADIWEFRCVHNKVQYRLLSFWDRETETLVIATHGFVKKTQKTPNKEIDKAERIRAEYLKSRRE